MACTVRILFRFSTITSFFLCAFSACKHNKGCKEIYERIVAKGKSKKLALIYDDTYNSILKN